MLVLADWVKLAKTKASAIPRNATVLNYNVERLILAKRQLGKDWSGDENISLLTEETSKFGEKYMGYHGAASDGNMMVIGLSEIETKSAKDTLSTNKEILRDIDECSKSTRNEASMKILVHTVATMPVLNGVVPMRRVPNGRGQFSACQ